MPYSSNSELPTQAKDLPEEAKTVFRRVFNDSSKSGKPEEQAFAYAWTAVKNGWRKNSEGKWEKLQKNENNHLTSNSECDISNVEVNSTILKVDDSLGLVFGYAMVCKIDGEEHFDLQGHHIPEETMTRVLAKFMQEGAIAKEMHSGDPVGKFVFAFPMTTDIAKSLDITVKQTGALVAMKPDNQSTLQKFTSGVFTGFSIGGVNPVFEDVE